MTIILQKENNRGFMALIAVILLATGALAFSLVVLSSSFTYFQATNKREMRIQAGLNAKACLDEVSLMVIQDYFLAGEIEIKEFGCAATIDNDGNGNYSLEVKAFLGTVSEKGKRMLKVSGNLVQVL
ncbi:MAG: hypothetical protein WCT02_01990 [Candidatus Paceibacterota bacterium]